MPNNKTESKVNIKLSGIGWKSRIILKRATAYISINKLVVNGCDLEKGMELHSYLAEESNRKIIVIYLDGKKKQTDLKFRKLK
jgi:hypothetical protein